MLINVQFAQVENRQNIGQEFKRKNSPARDNNSANICNAKENNVFKENEKYPVIGVQREQEVVGGKVGRVKIVESHLCHIKKF